MRLGGWFGTENIAGLEGLCAALDAHGLSASHDRTRLDLQHDGAATFGDNFNFESYRGLSGH